MNTAIEHLGIDPGNAQLRRQLEAETERADYAWRNTRTIEAARQAEMATRDAAQAEVSDLKDTIIALLCILQLLPPNTLSNDDRPTILRAMYQAGILTDPATVQHFKQPPEGINDIRVVKSQLDALRTMRDRYYPGSELRGLFNTTCDRMDVLHSTLAHAESKWGGNHD